MTETDVAYKFADLSKDAKQTAIEHFSDIMDYEWWKWTLEDAEETIGLKIEEFDLEYRGSISGRALWSGKDVCKQIMGFHGTGCETYKIAVRYSQKYAELQKKYLVLDVKEKMTQADMYDERQELDTESEELDESLEKELLDAYLKILRDEYEYLQSDEAIIETIEANDYEFEEDGTLI